MNIILLCKAAISHKTQEKMEDNLYVKFILKRKKKVVEKSLYYVSAPSCDI